MRINLAEFAGGGTKEVKLLLDSYNESKRKPDNSVIKVRVAEEVVFWLKFQSVPLYLPLFPSLPPPSFSLSLSGEIVSAAALWRSRVQCVSDCCFLVPCLTIEPDLDHIIAVAQEISTTIVFLTFPLNLKANSSF